MKMPGILISGKQPRLEWLPFALAAMAFVVTGCPHNQYIVELKPQGNTIERTLVFYREDGVDTNTGTPNYEAFNADELAVISSFYPAQGLTNSGDRHVARGEFANELPADVGGAGVYTNLTTRLGTVGFYTERFRGDDDLAGMTERRLKAADQLADLFVGWGRMELGREPGYAKLHQFLDVDFRRDLKNFSAYWWGGQLVSAYQTNADEEFTVRFAQYLLEHSYFTVGEMPGLFKDVVSDDSQAILRRIQRLAARKMGLSDSEPLPASLAFLNNDDAMEKSFDKYLTGTAAYRTRLKQWKEDRKSNPGLKQPEPSAVMDDFVGAMIEFDLFGQTDHLTVRLSLPSAPAHSNGRWDAAHSQVVWETDIEERTNASHFPFSCFAIWAQPDQEYQRAHFGKVTLTGDALTRYCLWRNGQDAQHGKEWDNFVAGLQPGNDPATKLDAFRFTGEPVQTETNAQQKVSSPSDFPRSLLKTALE